MLLRSAARRCHGRINWGVDARPISSSTVSSTSTPSTAHRTSSSSVPSAPPAQQISAFPSLLIGSSGSLTPRGSFAEAQASFLDPPAHVVESLLDKLLELKIGIVAHYYMDVELQGVLHAVKKRQSMLHRRHPDSVPATPLVAVADSLKMGDDAVHMCRDAGVRSVICLGVDFMSESVSAILHRNHLNVPVYRASQRHIGCSLAESAETSNYKAWLTKSADDHNNPNLHVVYINTSLETKAVASSILPTITCTSSNVLQTILQASAQLGPTRLRIRYGPDTYMGHNLLSLLDAVLKGEEWDDSRISNELHPRHDRASIRSLRDNIDVYPHGNCVVHHMFGRSVVDAVQNHYEDAYVTAHLEVPGEMFQIALQKSLVDRGVVGSTSNILNFVERKVEEAARSASAGHGGSADKTRLKFILGTEAGMVTSIVRSVQDILDSNSCDNVEAEIIFPVSSEAVVGVDQPDASTMLEVVPGVSGGEGCSAAGGCATCPFMKMNDLDAVHDIVEMICRSTSLRIG